MTAGSAEVAKGAMILVAAGRGERFGSAKQWACWRGEPLMVHAARGAWRSGLIDEMVAVVAGGDEARSKAAFAAAGLPPPVVVAGGGSRQASVALGLASLPSGRTRPWIAVHDAARPVLPPDLLRRLAAAVGGADGSVPVLPVTDTLRWTDAPGGPERSRLVAVGTPQLFREAALRAAHRQLSGDGYTDDASMVEATGGRIVQVPGDPAAFKVTFAADLARLDLAGGSETVSGQGIDHHRIVRERGARLILGGVVVAEDVRLEGHSDGDVVLHAVADAVRGAAGLPDIGTAFPPGEAATRGMSSGVILDEALARLSERGGVVRHAQVTLIAGWPRLSPVRHRIARRLAELLALPVDRVAVHATSGEGLGEVGRGHAVEVHALVTVDRLRSGRWLPPSAPAPRRPRRA